MKKFCNAIGYDLVSIERQELIDITLEKLLRVLIESNLRIGEAESALEQTMAYNLKLAHITK